MKKISININQQAMLVDEGEVLEKVLGTQSLAKVFAIAVNKRFVARDDYGRYRLSDQDVIAILTPMQGG